VVCREPQGPCSGTSRWPLTTVRTGGAAEYFARAGSEASCSSCSPGRGRSGPGRRRRVRLEPADRRRGRARASCQARSRARAIARRGAPPLRRRRAAARGRGARGAAGLSGIEFGVNIPGTVGGAVRMNANAYGGELARALEWVEIVTAEGVSAARPGSSEFGYRRSSLAAGEIVARASFALVPAQVATSRRRSRRCAPAATRPSRRGSRRSARPSRTPRIRGPHRGALRRAAAGRGRLQRPERRRRALRAQARQLHREHRHGHDRGRDRRDGRGPPPRARALRRGARAGGADARRRALSLVGVRPPGSKTLGMERSLACSLSGRVVGHPVAPVRSSREVRAKLVPGDHAPPPPARRAPDNARGASRCSPGGWMWLRKSSFTAVEHVKVSGLHGAEARAIETALTGAGRQMSTLDTNTAALRAAVRRSPSCARSVRSRAFRTACGSR
jgi:hypothetical protein